MRSLQHVHSSSPLPYNLPSPLPPSPLPHSPQTLAMVDATGAAGLTGMMLLDRGHTTRFGHPEPTAVSAGRGWVCC